MSKIPEIRIYFAWLLYYGECQTLAGDNKLESYEKHEEWTDDYRKEWKQYEQKIVPALQDVLGVTFHQPVIDVACAPYFIPKSEPLIMNFHNTPRQFVDALTHELCHVLLTDNNVLRIKDEKPAFDLLEKWRELVDDTDDFNYLVHIPVHALCKYIYLDVLKDPSRLSHELKAIREFETAEPYIKSWEYVETHDYKDIIERLKQSYKEAVV